MFKIFFSKKQSLNFPSLDQCFIHGGKMQYKINFQVIWAIKIITLLSIICSFQGQIVMI